MVFAFSNAAAHRCLSDKRVHGRILFKRLKPKGEENFFPLREIEYLRQLYVENLFSLLGRPFFKLLRVADKPRYTFAR